MSPLFTENSTKHSPVSTQSTTTEPIFYRLCNDRIAQLLEQQISLQQKSNQLQALQLEIALQDLKEKEAKIEQIRARMEAEANKPWYQTVWDNLVPNVKDTIIKLIIRSITEKIINSSVTALDHVTGDLPVKNGYDKYALYAGTFIVESSITGYLNKKDARKNLADPRLKAVNAETDQLLTDNHTTRALLDAKADLAKVKQRIEETSPDVLAWRRKTELLLATENTRRALVYAQTDYDEVQKRLAEGHEPSIR